MRIYKRLLSWTAALAITTQLLSPVAFAVGQQARSTDTQTSSAQETVYVNSYGGSARQVDFNDHWRFNLGDGSAATDYNDSSWQNIDLPHDYSIEQPFSQTNEAESGYLPGGTGWYRKTFTLSADWKDKVITVDFGGVYMNATVYLNGEELGFHPYGYTAFSFQLPQELLDFEGENVLAVKVDHRTPSSRWYSGSGIYRDVTLTVTDPVHVAQQGTHVTTPDLAEKQDNPTVHVETTLQNQGNAAVQAVVRQSVYAAGGEEPVATLSGKSLTLEAGAEQTVAQEGTVSSPALWSPDSPSLYYLKTEVVVEDVVVDTYTTEFGFRWTNFNTTNGFELNGVAMKLKGVCMHHDQGPLGSEAWYRAIERQVEILKEMGVNAIRVTHNPAAPALVEIANRKGMMLIDEAFDTWTQPKNGNVNDYSAWFNRTIGADNQILGGEADMTWAEYDIKAMVRQDRNSPAVIMYSLGNEIFEGVSGSANSTYPSIAQNLINWIKEEDTTRPPTFGDNKLKENWDVANRVAEVVAQNGGVIGYNYSQSSHLNTGLGKNWKVYHSETASAVNSNGVYDRKNSNGDGGRGDKLLTSYDKSAVGWGAVASDAWWRVATHDAGTGEFVWTGFDYIGEPTPWNGIGTGSSGSWPAPKSSYFGIIDTNGIPKDTYWFYQSQWNEAVTTLHLLPTWDRDDVVFGSSNDVEVVVYSDAPVIKLFRNGDLVGAAKSVETPTGAGYTYRTWTTADMNGQNSFDQKSGHQSLYATFWVPYEEGTLEVKAYQADGETEITDTEGRSVVNSTNGANQLEAVADRTSITADGDDLSYVTITVKDANGNPVNTDDVNVKLSITGEGKIIGVDNGRQADHTSYQSLSRNTGAGKLVAVVQSTDKAGSFTVTAQAEGLKSTSVTVTTTEPDNAGDGDNSIVSYTISRHHYVKVGSVPQLPQQVTVTYRNGTQEQKNVVWNAYDESLIQQPGSFAVTGTLEGTPVTVSVNVTMLDKVAALLNYSAAAILGSDLTLPQSRPAVLADGTVLNAEFPVAWEDYSAITQTEGTHTVTGKSTVFGEEFTVTASVRVAEGTVSIGSNVAANAAGLTQDVPAGQESDTLEAIRDGDTTASPNNSGGANPTIWSNYTAAQNGQKQTSLTFRYDTAQLLGQVVMYFYTDSYSAALPSAVEMSWSNNGNEWNSLAITQDGEDTESSDNVTRRVYSFAPQDCVFLRITLTNKEGKPATSAQAYCVGLSEVELKTAQISFPVSSSAALTGITVNGDSWSDYQLEQGRYTTEALIAQEISVENGNNAAYTVLPAYEDVVKILTQSEDHTASGEYRILLNTKTTYNPSDASRDYPYGNTAVEVASEQSVSGNEGPKEFAIDNNPATFWHSKWNEYLENQPEKRYIQLNLNEVQTLDALRYQPRNSIANGIVTKYRIEVSTDKEHWNEVASGTWAHTTDWKIATFDPVEAQYIRLYGVETRGSAGDVPNRFMSCAELRVCVAPEKIDLSEAQITLNQDSFEYTGFEIEPEFTVTLNGEALTYGLDYAVSYANNIQPGEATLTIRGICDYTGTASVNFTIESADVVVESYSPVEITTYAGVAPELPATVTAQVNIGPDQEMNVVWDAIDPSQYAQAGTFTVSGTVEGQTLKPQATVTVLGVAAVQTVSAVTVEKTLPALPGKVDVYFHNGTVQNLPVVWEAMEPSDFVGDGAMVTVSGTITLGEGVTCTATAKVRVAAGTATNNLALAGNDTLPLAVSFYAPDSDSAVNINDGDCTFSVAEGKKVWSDWERDTYHDAPWVAIILGEEEVVVNHVSLGFIDEHASNDPNVAAGNKVRLPAAYVIQYYTGDYENLDFNASQVNNGRNWPVMNGSEHWQTVAVIRQDEIPSSAEFDQMLHTYFEPVKTTAIRVVMTPQENQWVGIDELEIYGLTATPGSTLSVEDILLDGKSVMNQFDDQNRMTLTLEEGQDLPEVTVNAAKGNAVTVIPMEDRIQIVVTSEDGTKSVTYEILIARTGEHTHTYGEPVFTFSEDGKSATAAFACTGCDDVQTLPADITYEVKTGATCTEKGVTTYTATVTFGGEKYTATKDVADIPMLDHQTAIRNQKDATCTEAGYTGDTVCTVCDTVVAEGKVIPALGHKTELRGQKDATCTEAGYTGDQVCTVCQEVVEKGEVIPAKGHHYEDGVCTECGEKDPDYTEPTDPTDPSEPTKPTDPSEPTKPTDPSEPTKPTDPSEPTKPTDPSEPTKPTESSEPTEKPAETTKPATDPNAPDQTGDTAPLLLLAALVLVSGSCLAVIVAKTRKYNA